MKNKAIRILICFSFILLFLVFINKYLSYSLWDYDFWWHIATGRYIVENHHLPESDPFSYATELEENKNLIPERESFILTQYWISQIVFFFIYRTFNDAGIIILRALIFLTIIVCILWKLQKNGVSFYLCFLSVFLVGVTTLSFTAERPVLITMLFSVIVYLLLDNFRIRKDRLIFLLPPVMLLWANMHGGFILGDVMIGAFIVGETVSKAFKRSVYTKKELLIFYFTCIFAIAISAVNPNGFEAFTISLSPKYNIFLEGIEEYSSTFSLYKNNLRPLDIGYLVLLILLPITFILRAKRLNASHVLLLTGLTFMSLISFRFVIYFVFIAAIIVVTELHYLLEALFKREFFMKNQQRITFALVMITFVSSIALFSTNMNFNWFNFKKATRYSVPENAVDFIEKNNISGRLYNDFVFGGYVTWRLYPWKKTFIDTRAINYTVLSEARWINFAKESLQNKAIQAGKTPLWERLLDHYEIDIVLLDTLDVHGLLAPLVMKLLDNRKWVPVHVDLISVVFVRDKQNNRSVIEEHYITKDAVLNAILQRALRGALTNKRNPNFLISIGTIHYHMGRMNDALIAYDYAIERLPKNDPLRNSIEELRKKTDSELRLKKSSQ